MSLEKRYIRECSLYIDISASKLPLLGIPWTAEPMPVPYNSVRRLGAQTAALAGRLSRHDIDPAFSEHPRILENRMSMNRSV
ncbi:hypothetical protein TRAPUB_13830 [Trametes pubescens]|uniref:Uncharacterized protein n=1 Tax=Trametes pubescens TaxID=154538 RepID=A0A1M2VQ60_TRAPU|nr:hypothetical protein TRAPUB_13830 [Trametes pubescens]